MDRDIQIDYASRRIVWSKFFNAGQTCVAPDYLLVDNGIKGPFLDALKKAVIKLYGRTRERVPTKHESSTGHTPTGFEPSWIREI